MGTAHLQDMLVAMAIVGGRVKVQQHSDLGSYDQVQRQVAAGGGSVCLAGVYSHKKEDDEPCCKYIDGRHSCP